MPATAAERGLADPNDPEAAIPKAAELLANLKQRFGNLGLAAAAYNAGATRVANWLAGGGELPPETRGLRDERDPSSARGLERPRRSETDRRHSLPRCVLRPAHRRREPRQARGPRQLGDVGALGKRLLERGGHVDCIRQRGERLSVVAANSAILHDIYLLAASPGYRRLCRPDLVPARLYPQAAQAHPRRTAAKQNSARGPSSLRRDRSDDANTCEAGFCGRQERIPPCGAGRAPVRDGQAAPMVATAGEFRSPRSCDSSDALCGARPEGRRDVANDGTGAG